MQTSAIGSNTSLSVLVEAEYSTLLTKVNASNGFKNDTEKKNYEENRSRIIHAYGGMSEYSIDILTGNNYTSWIQSINGNEVFCDFTDNGMIPIWDFCQNASRKDELMKYYDTWAAQRQIATHDAPTPPQNCIIDIKIVSSSNSQASGDYFDSGGLRYYKINSDLNRGATGWFSASSDKYIYIYAAIGLDTSTNPNPITGLRLMWGWTSEAKNSPPSGYTVINQDLNEGAGGRYIYLCISRDPNQGPPIRGLYVWDKDHNTRVYSQGANSSAPWFDVISTKKPTPLDLNKGAGGDYIYLLYTNN
jgi:hypothetical protein